jgi:hypothetical protein
LIFVTAPNAFYVYIFEHEVWKLWKYFEENIDKFEFDGSSYDPNFEPKISNLVCAKEFIFGDYRAIVWLFSGKKPFCSIHLEETHECVLGSWWERKSRKFAKKLLKKLDV